MSTDEGPPQGTEEVPETPLEAPRPHRLPPRALELVVVGVVLATGLGLSVYAFATEPSDAELQPAADSGGALPLPPGATSIPSISLPSPPAAPSIVPGPGAIIIDGSSDIDVHGCGADLTFTWKIAPGNEDLLGKEATIRVDGPDGVIVYGAPVTKNGITLEAPVGIRNGGGKWVARIFGIEGTFPEMFPLEVSYSGSC